MVNLLFFVSALIYILYFIWHNSCILFVFYKCHIPILCQHISSCLLHYILWAGGRCGHLLIDTVKSINLLFKLLSWQVNVLNLLIHLFVFLSKAVVDWTLVYSQKRRHILNFSSWLVFNHHFIILVDSIWLQVSMIFFGSLSRSFATIKFGILWSSCWGTLFLVSINVGFICSKELIHWFPQFSRLIMTALGVSFKFRSTWPSCLNTFNLPIVILVCCKISKGLFVSMSVLFSNTLNNLLLLFFCRRPNVISDISHSTSCVLTEP